MASNGPPVVEHLLTRVRRWIIYFAGGSFWPLTNERPEPERPHDDPVPPDDHDEEEIGVVGLDDGNGLQEAQVDPRGGNREGDGEEIARNPSPPLQQLPPPHYGMEWPQQLHAFPFPVYYPAPYPVPYAVPHAFPFAYPYGFPHASPAISHAFPFADPFAVPYAAPAVPHAAFLHAAAVPRAFPFADPYTFPYAALAFYHAAAVPRAFPLADPYAFPYAAPAFPGVDPDPVPYADPDVALEHLIAMYWQGRPEEDEFYDVFELEDKDGIEIPQLDVVGGGFVENIGPLSPEGSLEEFSCSGLFSSFTGAPESPSTSGISCTSRRCREESDGEEAPAKRPRWSDASDSD